MELTMMSLVQRFPIGVVFVGSGIIYFVLYLLQYAYAIDISNHVLSWIYTQALLLGTSQFSFMVGMFFRNIIS